jgi:HEAT repeat protein
VEFEAALCIAVGLAQPREGLGPLMERMDRARMVVVDAAAQGLGLLGQKDPRALRVLVKAMRSEELDLVEDAALSLDMLGDTEMDRRIPAMYAAAHDSQTRRALRVALAQAGGRLRIYGLASRLLAAIGDMTEDPRTREAAATALGFLASPDERDPLAAMHADFEFHARSTTTEHVTWLCGNYLTITRPKTNPRDRK